MNPILAHIEKDFVAHWRLFVLWFIGVAAVVYVHIDRAGSTELGFSVSIELFAGLLVGWLLLQDPAGDSDATWRTQPVAWWQLLTAKAVTIAAVVVVPLLIGEALSYAAAGLDYPTLPAVLMRSTLWLLLVAGFAAAIASLVRSFAVFVAAYLLAVFGLLIAMMQSLVGTPTPVLTELFRGRGAGVLLLFMAATTLLLLARYRQNRYGPALLIAPVILVLTPVAAAVINYSDPAADEPRMETQVAGTNPDGLFSHGVGDDGYVHITPTISIPPPSPDRFPSVQGGAATLVFADGKKITSRGFDGRGGVDGEIRLWSLFKIEPSVYARYADQPARLELKIYGHWATTRSVEMPLETGARAVAGQTRVDVARLGTERGYSVDGVNPAGVTLHVRFATPDVNVTDAKVLLPRQGSTPLTSIGDSSAPRPLSLHVPASTARLMYFVWLDQTNSGSRAVTRAWPEDARLVLDYTVAVARLEETAAIENFVLSDWSAERIGEDGESEPWPRN